MKIYRVTQIKFNRLVFKKSAKVRNISKSFTNKMAAKTNWHIIYMERNYVTVTASDSDSVTVTKPATFQNLRQPGCTNMLS